MRETPFDKEINELQGIATENYQKLRALECQRAEFLSVVKVGDVIKDARGKRTAKITAILPYWTSGYKLIGNWILKDGSLSKDEHELWIWDWPGGYPPKEVL